MASYDLNHPVRGQGPTDRLRAIEAEILQEKAEALGRSGERLEEALCELEKVRAAIHALESQLRLCSGPPGEIASLREAKSRLAAQWPVLLRRAQLAYQYLVIHREAVGARNHLDVDRCYKLAERLR